MKTQDQIVLELKEQGFKVLSKDNYGRHKIIIRKCQSGRRNTLAVFIDIFGAVYFQNGKSVLRNYTWKEVNEKDMKDIIYNIEGHSPQKRK